MSLHNAPPVSFPLGRSRFLGVLLLLVWCSAGLLTLAWWLHTPTHDLRPWLGVAAWLGAGFVTWLGWLRSPVGRLCWSGTSWTWESPAYQDGADLAAPRVVLDLQTAVLLHLDNRAGASWWLWAESASRPDAWLDLRRAMHASPRPELPTDILSGPSPLGADTATVEGSDGIRPSKGS